MPLPPELAREVVRFSLLPSSPSSSGANTPALSSSASSGSSTPLVEYGPSTPASSAGGSAASEGDYFSHQPIKPSLSSSPPTPSRVALLRSLSLTSPIFRAVSQPLLFRAPVLPTLSSTLSFLAALDAAPELALAVRTLEVGMDPEEAQKRGLGALDAKAVLGRLGETVGRTCKEVTVRGCGRVRVEDLRDFTALERLTIDSCLLAPSLSADISPFTYLKHLTLSSNHLTVHALPSPLFLFPALTSLSLELPLGSIASSPGQLADLVAALAPQLRSFRLHDPAFTSAASVGIGGPGFNPLLDALSAFSDKLVHLETANVHPLVLFPHLSPSARRSIRTLGMSLAGTYAPPVRMRWQPLVDSLLRDTLALLQAVLVPPDLSDPAALMRVANLPHWVADLDEALERVYLPVRCADGGLGEMVDELGAELERFGRGVEVVVSPAMEAVEGDRAEGVGKVEDGAEFWMEVRRREEGEREEKRRAEQWW
ncbi:hypothetical protein JCM8097_005007 [Rhodosporidiobolus ruineniae]